MGIKKGSAIVVKDKGRLDFEYRIVGEGVSSEKLLNRREYYG